MPKKRPSKRLTPNFKVICEGSTEKHYVDGLRKWLSKSPLSSYRIMPVDAKGGGYSVVLDHLRKTPDSNCVAVIALFDFDRYISTFEERKVFTEILELSKNSIKKRVPIILVVSNPDFEYVICAHDPDFRNGDITKFLVKSMRYENLDACKADDGVWDKVHSGNRSHEVALEDLSECSHIITNDLEIGSGRLPGQVILKGVACNLDAQSVRTSNLGDLFEVVTLGKGAHR